MSNHRSAHQMASRPTIQKRKHFILTACRDYMRQNCPGEYRIIMDEAYKLIPGFECPQRAHKGNRDA